MGAFNWLRSRFTPPAYFWPVAGALGALFLGLAGARLFASSPRLLPLLAVVAGLGVAALVWVARWRLSLYGVLVTFIFVGLLATYVPFSVRIASLNLRPHQLLLPVAVVWLLAVGAFNRASRSRLWLAAAGLALWGTTLFWTVANLGHLRSPGQSLGRVGLLAINLLTAVVIYLMVVHTGKWREATRTFQKWVVGLNAVLLGLATLATLGVTQIRGWLGTDEEPVLVGGQVVTGETLRFAGGVVNGVVASLGLILIMVQWPHASRRARRGLLAGAMVCGAGIVIGFSRQSLVSFAGALVVLAYYLMRRGQMRRLVQWSASGILVGVLALAVASQWSVTRSFYQAFAARALLLLNPRAYVTGTANDRLVMWSGMLNDIAANPFAGAGQDGYLIYYPVLGGGGSHNYPLEVLHTTGVWGFIPYLYIHFVVGIEAWRTVRRRGLDERDRWLLLGLLAGYAAAVLSSLTNLIFTNTTYWLLLGLVAGSTRVVRQGQPAPPAGA